MNQDKPSRSKKADLNRSAIAQNLRATVTRNLSAVSSSNLPAVTKSVPPSKPDSDSPEPNGDLELANAICALADEAAKSIEMGELREARQRKSLWMFAGIFMLGTILQLLALWSNDSHRTKAFDDLANKLSAWEAKADEAAKRDKAAEIRIEKLETRLEVSIDVNKRLARSVATLMEAEATQDKSVARKLRARAEVDALGAQSKAVESEIQMAKAAGKPPPLRAVRELASIKLRRAKRQRLTAF